MTSEEREASIRDMCTLVLAGERVPAAWGDVAFLLTLLDAARKQSVVTEQGPAGAWSETGTVIERAHQAGKVGDFAALVRLCLDRGTDALFYAVSEGGSVFCFAESDIVDLLAADD